MTKAPLQQTTRRHSAARFISLSVVAFLLAGCASQNDTQVGDPLDSLQGQRAATERRLATAAADAIQAGKTQEALVSYEKLYQRDNRNADVAVNYAQLLRRSGKADQAAKILAPFAEGKRKDSSRTPRAMLKNEYAAALIETGKFDRAQTMLESVLSDPALADFHPDASNLSGIALDAQGQHKAAEKLFRQALDGWKGDPTSVMNNLALNLASQGMFDEALTTLRRAQIMAPEKSEIARNIEIVSGLRDVVVPKAPVSLKK
ncbi:MAG: tetratricopeptide repeat protein [Alphaproteobacteria bacterium]|nr:tetratricopeptide repeat protein [Alphaproteobacteria bacterium]